MAHAVSFSIPARKLGKRDIVFRVRKDGSPFEWRWKMQGNTPS